MTNLFRPWMVVPPLAVLMVWGSLGYLPARSASASAEQRISSAQEAQTTGHAQRVSLELFAASPTEIDQRVRSAQASVPSKLQVAAFVRTLEQLAIESALHIEVLAPNGVSDDSFVDGNDPLPVGLSSVSIAISATGSYDEITDFVERLEQTDRLVLVDEIEITTTDDNLDALGLDLSLRIFTTAELIQGNSVRPIDESGEA